MRRGSNSHHRTGSNEELISQGNNALCEENKVTEDVASFQRCPSKDKTNASEIIETYGEDELRDGTLSCEADISNASEIQTSESKECMGTVQSKRQFIHLPFDKQKSSETHHLQASTEENTDCAILGNLIASTNEKCVSADTLDTKHCLISPSLGRSVTEEESAHYSSLSHSPTVAGTTASVSPCMLLNDPENRLKSAGSENGGSSTASRGVEPEHKLIMRTSSVEILRRVKPENSSAKSRVFVIQPSFKQVVNPVSDRSKTEDILVLISEKSAPNQDLSEENQQDDPGKNVSPEVKCTSTSRSKPGSERNVLQQNRCAETQCNLSSGHERSSSSREDVDGCDEWSQEGSIELNESSNYPESLWVDGTLQMPNRRKASQKDLNKRCVKIQCNIPQSSPSSKPTRQFEARSKSYSPPKSTSEHDLSSSRFFEAFPALSDMGKSRMTENLSNLSERESVASSTQIIIEEKILVRSTNKMNDKMTVKDDKCTLSTNILSNIRDLLIGTFSDSSSMHEDSCGRPLVDSILSPTVPCPDQKVGDDSIPQKSKIQNQLFELEEQPSMVASECACSLQSDRDRCHGLGSLVKQSAPPTTIFDRRKNPSSPKKSRSMFDGINVSYDSIFKIRMLNCKSNDSHVSEDGAVCLDDRWIGSYKDDNDAQTHENTISQKSRSAINSRSLPELIRSKDRGYIAERTQSRTLECREKGSTRPQGSSKTDVNFAPVFLREADRRTRCPSISSEDVSGQAFCLYTLSVVDMGVGRRSRSVDAILKKRTVLSNTVEKASTPG
ncbi:unnamed protein product [Bemisia tabaci]|uniref:Uncharacterized protein n=1 Tax=Bemisia tabaci TaxID=7038 RepID=A0A9P0F4K3_BEMTA|nr:unnamed protein product [Bemisia tabaci]